MVKSYDFEFREQLNNVFTIKRQECMWYLKNSTFEHAIKLNPIILIIELEQQQRKQESFPQSSVSKESAHKAGEPSSIPGLERSPGEGHVNSRQYSCLENPKDSGTWQASVQGVTRVRHKLAIKSPPPPTHTTVFERKKEKGKLTFTKQLKIRYLRLTSLMFLIFKFAGELMSH